MNLQSRAILLCLCSITLSSIAGATKVATTSDMAPMLGQGYLKEREETKGECLTGTVVYEGMTASNVDFSTTIDEETLASELGIAAGGKARLGVTEASASAKFYNASRSDAFSISAIYTGTYKFKDRVFKEPKIRPEVDGYVENIERWREACGDEYVARQQLGAKLFFSIRIDFASKEERNAFDANFSLSAPLVSVEAKVAYAMASTSKRTKVSVNVLQIGGKVDRITEIFQPHLRDGNPEAGSNAHRFVQCSSGELNQCRKVLEQAIHYATDTKNGFPSQIDPALLNDPNSHGGPVVLSSATEPYGTAKVFFVMTPELNKQTEHARGEISNKFEEAYKQYERVNRLISNRVVRLSNRQKDSFGIMRVNLYTALQNITKASLRCYEHPKQCGEAFESLSTIGSKKVELYSESDFLVEPETFAQYCDLGSSSLSQRTLTNTIEAMLDSAKKMNPDFFNASYEGEVVDECHKAETAFERATTLVLDGYPIEDLRPVSILKHLKLLSLRGAAISTVVQLAGLANLETLNLSNNKLRNLDGLNLLSRLRELDVSDNRIHDASSMAMVNQLAKLDLRNNAAEVVCPFQEKERCIVADFRTNNSFIPIYKNTNAPRIAHAAAKLADGRVLIVGGKVIGLNSSLRAEIYDARTGNFQLIGEMVRPRYYHSATTLIDGNVLIVGGVGKSSSKTAELFMLEHEGFFPTNGGMTVPRSFHTATLLKDGRVLIAGGFSNDDGLYRGRDATLTTEIFEPSTGKFSAGPAMRTPRAAHRATLLSDGTVLVTGGEGYDESLTTAEIYLPTENRFKRVKGRMNVGRAEHSASLLKDGSVLVAGGFDGKIAIDRAELFHPETQTFTVLNNNMNSARAEHDAHLLSDGRIVLIGGRSGDKQVEFDVLDVEGGHASAEIFDPLTKLFTQSPKKMSAPRAVFTSTMVDEDRVLLVGGLGGLAEYSAELFEYAP